MNACESHEIVLSSLLDGEAEPERAAAAVEHALGCADCAVFFRAARRLQEPARRLAAASEAVADDGADRLWSAIERRAAGADGAGRWARGLRAAALVVLGLGGGYLLSTMGAAGDALAPAAGGTVVTASARDGRPMDERRFVALADELMRADPRFQRAMLEVLRLVPALETGEGIGHFDESRPVVRATVRDDGPGAGLL